MSFRPANSGSGGAFRTAADSGGALRSHYLTIDTFIIMAQIPVGCLGGLLAVIITARPFSVSAAVGFISIFGIAVMDDVLLRIYIRALWDEGYPFVEATILGSDRRFRAVMMTATVNGLGAPCWDLDENRRGKPTTAGDCRNRRMRCDRSPDPVLQPILIYLLDGDLRRGDKATRPLVET